MSNKRNYIPFCEPNGPIIVECESDQNIKTGQLLKIKFDTNKFNLFNDHDSII